MKKITFISIFFSILIVFIFTSITSAQTADELRGQIDNTNIQIEQLNKEIEALNIQLTKTGGEKKTLLGAVNDLILKRKKLLTEKEQTQKKINATGMVITSLSGEITVKDSTINESKNSLGNFLNDLYQQDNQTFFLRLLSTENLSEASREYNNIIGIDSKIKSQIKEVVVQKEVLTETRTKKEIEQDALNKLKNNLTQKQIEIENNKKEKDTLLAQTKNKESNYQKLLAETEKTKNAFEKSLEDYESQLKFILNPKLIPKTGSGVLSWPLTNVLITSPYGSRWGRFHYGLDFRASIGSKVMAMGSGTVLGTGDTDIACKGASFGKWVFIKYDDGLSSTYGHLSSITASVGDKVKAGDIVAYSGNTGSSTGPHLHVAVYASDGVKVDTVPSKACGGKIFTQPISALTAYLDPGLYLPKILASMIKK